MLYYSSLRTLNAIRVHLKQTIGEHSYYSGRITSLNHKLEQMVACHKQLREDFKTYAESHKHKNRKLFFFNPIFLIRKLGIFDVNKRQFRR